jgi:multiple sugar transport system substrate-binding protein
MKAKRIVIAVVLLVITATAAFFVYRRGPKKTVINIVGEALPPLESLGELAKQYTRETGVEVRIHPFEFETALQRTQLDFSSHSGEYDLVMAIFFNQGRYAESGSIIPFSDKRFKGLVENPVTREDFYPPVRAVTMDYHGQVVAYPFSAQTMFLWFRKDLFENDAERTAFKERYKYDLPIPDVKTPLTWKQYRDLAEFFSRESGKPLAGKALSAPFYGTALQMRRHPSSFYEFTNFVYSFGGGFFDDKGHPTIASEANQRALEFYLGLRKFAPPGYLQATWDDALAQMQQGTVAMTIMWSDAPSELYNPDSSRVVGRIGYSLVPVDELIGKKVSVFGGWGFMINSDTKIPEECYKFVQWVCRPKNQLAWAKLGGLPAAAAVFSDPDFTSIPYMPAQNEALKNLVSWPRDPKAEQFVNLGIEMLSMATSDQLSPSKALSQFQSRATKLYGDAK